MYPNQPLLEHWDGSTWQVASGPALPDDSWLNGVGVISADDVWAVGTYAPTTSATRWSNMGWLDLGRHLLARRGRAKGYNGDIVLRCLGCGGGNLPALGWVGLDRHQRSGWRQPDRHRRALLHRHMGSRHPATGRSEPHAGGALREQLLHSFALPDPYFHSAGRPHARPPPPPATATATAAPSATATLQLPSSTPTISPTTAIPTTTPTTTELPTGTPVPLATTTPVPTATPTACSITFNDEPPGSTFFPFVRCLACLGVVQGYPDGTYRPNNPVTRGQAAKIIANSAGYTDPIPPSRQTFNDVPPGSTFWLYIEKVALHDAINGYPCGSSGEPCPGTYFRPQNTLTRGQAAKVAIDSGGLHRRHPIVAPNVQRCGAGQHLLALRGKNSHARRGKRIPGRHLPPSKPPHQGPTG